MQKKLALAPAGVEQVEHAWGDLRLRAVVNGQGDFSALRGSFREALEVGAEQGTARQQAGDGQYEVVKAQRAESPRPLSRHRQQSERCRAVHGERDLDGE
jgi:hypothetical protein